jgi:hypothetical protein
MLTLLLIGCGTSPGGDASIDTTALFPATEDRFTAYRHLSPDEYAASAADDSLEGTDLLLARFATGGCGGDAWRVELRVGTAWESAAAAGALHFDDKSGLSICGVEDTSGALETLEPPVVLWEANGLKDGATISSGGVDVTAAREIELHTYFGLFPQAVSFALAGSGPLDGWTLHFADSYGLVLIEATDYTADLVYNR